MCCLIPMTQAPPTLGSDDRVDCAIRGRRYLSLVSASRLINRNIRLYRALVDKHFTDCHNVLMDMVAPKTGKRTALDVEITNDLSSDGISSHSNESTEASCNISVDFDEEYSQSNESFVQSDENSVPSEGNSTQSEKSSSTNEESSHQSEENFERFEEGLTDREEISNKSKESPVRRKENSMQSEKSTAQHEDIINQRTPSKESSVESGEHTNQIKGIHTQSAESSFQSKDNSATDEDGSAESERRSIRHEEIVSRSTRTRQDSSEHMMRNADSILSLSRKRSSETSSRSSRNDKRNRSATRADTGENAQDWTEEQEESSPSMIVKRDVAIQTNNSYLKRRCQERFDENKPFGFTVIYDNYRDRVPSKIIFSSLSAEVKNL